MTSITNATLGWNEAGTPVSDQFDDVYFSNVNGLEETRYVFLSQNHIPQRWHQYDQKRFVIAETGFGTGLNFLAVWQEFDAFRQQNPNAPLQALHFISFEKYPLNKHDLITAHQAWPELATYAKKLQQHYPIAVPECHRIVLDDGAITLDLWFGDIKECMPQVPTTEQGVVDAWFLDGFAPSKNPEMWNQTLFENMAKLAKHKATCATFTAAGFVRRGLIEAGFSMKKVKGFGTKREMIAGQLEHKTPYSNIKPWFAIAPTTNVTDVAIIGGGIASATLAKMLNRRGINVSLYCADPQAAQGASGNRQGAVYPLLNKDHSGVSRVFAPAFLFARQFVEQMAQTVPFDHDWCGVTQLMWDEKSTQKQMAMLEGKFNPQLMHYCDQQATLQNVGLPTDMVSLHYPLGGWLCPAQLTQGLFDQLSQSERFNAYFNHEVESLRWDEIQRQWTLSINGNEKHHQCVVIANGHQFDHLEQTQALPLGKVKGQVSHIPTSETLQKLSSVLCYDGYMTPHNPNTQQHCIGASYDRSQINQAFDAAAQQENGQRLTRCINDQNWTQQVDTSSNQSRQGVRCVSRDHLPFVGNVGNFEQIKLDYQPLTSQDPQQTPSVAHYPHLYCMLGLGSRGLSSAPLMAELLASQMNGDPLPLAVDVLETLHPSRMWVRKLKKGKAITERTPR
ncbi:bifunctional tRNA (5-methylaminomethyl-2-thiouridine)(34)-methyltransferase MnmD/FAD-dependent 5-carboxymethylaminomethyl-2-thiouridine(34) oxidoreductase MnmC [Vibrio anguillarum]|uniref:tRNA 5-methylaminomethyl-2-thiouridine biosynthesis bifunctional protein MnmC n=1 Tax=Vibrio anguillarum TaxID=55601 RepID=A0AAW4AUD1_VIBAN|nr:bifunctional tRNA (5-methylaminomethyl-2-thiouridine)(34)-methyltransferase MnmD/FAD-dependent 5-carboxymethylaminomethyl-2-thiouridine(34) oxidoreductase MnmC [Vibrio anguillarum]AEH32640.1 tRNA (5-carboxymethylaminomethyl-2-thiouridylate) oxidase [Vibrio anguillarum 775]AGU57202.1 tRNA methyltransferase [Vibrio anguillarum M3]ARV28207.1 tRNA U-34 5-methylaminomethyl-2-thiouridine biosynthesis protein MnmC [Vibrio anguillarum]ASF92444.1 bifunctional tRNA (5-methylaminomethyl-2-thiouridine)(